VSDLNEVPVCDCTPHCNFNPTYAALKKTIELEQRQKLIHFLMRLNDCYDAIRDQILFLGPLPDTNKAYSMIQ